MRRILVAVSGSVACIEALEYVARRKRGGDALEVFIVNVQPCICPQGRLTTRRPIKDYQWNEGEKVLNSPAIKAHTALMNAEAYLMVGDAAEQIVLLAEDLGCTEIVLGNSGSSRLNNLFLGSVPLRVIALSSISVVVVKCNDCQIVDIAA